MTIMGVVGPPGEQKVGPWLNCTDRSHPYSRDVPSETTLDFPGP